MNDTMTATLIREHGGPERLLLETVQRPRPGAGEALVRVAACALNHLDIFVRRGTPGMAVRAAPHRRRRHRRVGRGARPADRAGPEPRRPGARRSRRAGRHDRGEHSRRAGRVRPGAGGEPDRARRQRSSDRDGGAADRLRDRPSHAADPSGPAGERDARGGGRQRWSRGGLRAARQARRGARDRLHEQRRPRPSGCAASAPTSAWSPPTGATQRRCGS